MVQDYFFIDEAVWKPFTTIIFCCIEQISPDLHWRNRIKQNDHEHHEKESFFSASWVLERFFLFCFWENVFFTSYVACYVICSCRKTFKQPLTNILQSRCSYKFCNIHRKTRVLESLFNNVAGLKAYIFIKRETPTQPFSCENCKIYKNNCFKNICERLFECFPIEHLFIILFQNFMW